MGVVLLTQWNPYSKRLSITADVAMTANYADTYVQYRDIDDNGWVWDSTVVDGQYTVILQMRGGNTPEATTPDSIFIDADGLDGLTEDFTAANGDPDLKTIEAFTPAYQDVIDEIDTGAVFVTRNWYCNDPSGTSLTDATEAANGLIVGSPTLGSVGGLWNEPFGGLAITLASGKYLRLPTGTWFPNIGVAGGIWGSLFFKNSSLTASNLLAGYRTAGFADGLQLSLNWNSTASGSSNVRVSVEATDPSGDRIYATYLFNSAFSTARRYADDRWHHVMFHIDASASPAVIQLWLDGVKLVPEASGLTGHDFSASQNLTNDLVCGGYSSGSGAYASNNSGLEVQRIALGTGDPPDLSVARLAQTLYYVDALGMRCVACWKPGVLDYSDSAFQSLINVGEYVPESSSDPLLRSADLTGNGYHLMENAYAYAPDANLTETRDSLLAVRVDDIDGSPYWLAHNVFGTTQWGGNALFRYCSMDIMPGIGGTCVEAMLNFSAQLGSSDVALYQSGGQRLFTFGAGVAKGSVSVVGGYGRLATTTNSNSASPFAMVRSEPSMSFFAACGGGDGRQHSDSVGAFYTDGVFQPGSAALGGTMTTPENIGGSTLLAWNGTEEAGGLDGFAGRIYGMRMCDTPWSQAELDAAYQAHLTEYGISDPPEAVVVAAGDSITELNASAEQKGWGQRLVIDGDTANWRRVAFYNNGHPGIELFDTGGVNGVDDIGFLTASDFAYGLDSNCRFTFIDYLGNNDLLNSEVIASSIIEYGELLAAQLAIVPLGAFVQQVGLTMPALLGDPLGNKATLNAYINGGAFDRVVTTPEYSSNDGTHPNDTGFQQIADAINNDAEEPMVWVLTEPSSGVVLNDGSIVDMIVFGAFRGCRS